MDRPQRLQDLYRMFERHLKRELTLDEKRLLALSAQFCDEEEQELGDAAASAAS